MLEISKISKTDALTPEWRAARNGRFTASSIGNLMSSESHKGKFDQGGMTYIENTAGEKLTGEDAKLQFTSGYTDYGNSNEAEGITHFCHTEKMPVLRSEGMTDTHRLILYDEYCSCTPDALVCVASEKEIFDATGTKLKVAPLEIKCPPIHHRYIKMFKCTTPAHLKKAEPMYYYQVLSQMLFCDSLIGYFGAYHSKFPVKMRVIVFKKMDLVEEFQKLKLTIDYAKIEYQKIIELFKGRDL